MTKKEDEEEETTVVMYIFIMIKRGIRKIHTRLIINPNKNFKFTAKKEIYEMYNHPATILNNNNNKHSISMTEL